MLKKGIATVYNGRKSSIMSTNIKQNPAFLQGWADFDIYQIH